jgi:hypothetical protein
MVQAMEWLKIERADDEWRIADSGRYLLHKVYFPSGNVGYLLFKADMIDIYQSAEAATEAIMTRTGRMEGVK